MYLRFVLEQVQKQHARETCLGNIKAEGGKKHTRKLNQRDEEGKGRQLSARSMALSRQEVDIC